MREEPVFVKLITRFHRAFHARRYPRRKGFISNVQNF